MHGDITHDDANMLGFEIGYRLQQRAEALALLVVLERERGRLSRVRKGAAMSLAGTIHEDLHAVSKQVTSLYGGNDGPTKHRRAVVAPRSVDDALCGRVGSPAE